MKHLQNLVATTKTETSTYYKIAKNGFKEIIKLLILFILVNLLAIVFCIVKLFNSASIDGTIILFLFVILTGIISTIIAIKVAYKTIFTKILMQIYQNLNSFLQNLSNEIIERISSGADKNNNFKQTKDVFNSLNYNELIESWNNKLPKTIKKSITHTLEKIPISKLALNLNADSNAEKSMLLYKRIDSFIVDNVFKKPNLSWWWILLMNLIIQTILIYLI